MNPELEKMLGLSLVKLQPGRRNGLVYFFINDLNNVPKLITNLRETAKADERFKDYSIESISVPQDFLPEGASSSFCTDFVDYANKVVSDKKLLIIQNIEDYFLRIGTKLLKKESLKKDEAEIVQETAGMILDGCRESIHKSLKQPIGLIFTNKNGLTDRIINLDAYTWAVGKFYLEEHY